MRRRAVGVALCVFALGACGNLTAGGFGELEVLVAADSVAASPAVDTRAAPSTLASAVAAQIEGTLTFSVRVFAVDSEGALVEITEGVRDVTMALSDASPVVLARRPLAAGRYATIRTVFLSVVAVVEGGLVVDGEPVRGPVTVQLGPDQRISVDAPVDLTIMDGDAAQVAIELHAHRWLRLLQQDHEVRTTDFSGEVRVRQRP